MLVNSKSIKISDWVVYSRPRHLGGDVLASVQDIYAKNNRIYELPPYYPDTSYTLVDGRVKYKEHFKCKVMYKNYNSGVYKITTTVSRNIRPLTSEEEHDLALYFKQDYPLIINKPLFKEVAKDRLKTGTHPANDKQKYGTSFL